MKAQMMSVMAAALALACGGAQQEPATPASEAGSEAASAPRETASSAGGGISYQGGSGLSCQEAIVVVGAQGESDGVASEYAWIERHYPGSSFKQQWLIECGGAAADQMEIVTADGKDVVLFFDISRFFGKL
jgi:hypothetical protein